MRAHERQKGNRYRNLYGITVNRYWLHVALVVQAITVDFNLSSTMGEAVYRQSPLYILGYWRFFYDKRGDKVDETGRTRA